MCWLWIFNLMNSHNRNPLALIRFVQLRIAGCSDAENVQTLIRISVVSLAMLFFHSEYFAASSTNTLYVTLARWAVSISLVVTLGLALALVIHPRESALRRIVGMIHDVAGISAALFLGEASTAPVAAIYLWMTLGNGFRYGSRYLHACAVMSIAGFFGVYWFSDYWHQQGTLSLSILIILIAVPPYAGRLLESLNKAQAQLRHQASTDGLTGLLNRAELVHGIEASLAQQPDGHFLLYCDLDHFKEVNDTAGHAAGDRLLIEVGRIILSCVRSRDLTARFGGDEFCVFLRDCPAEGVGAIAEGIRNAVSEFRLEWGSELFSVGISIGAAPSSAVREVKSLIRLADAGCYAAKNAGRNRVHIVDPHIDLADTRSLRTKLANCNRGQHLPLPKMETKCIPVPQDVGHVG